MELVVLADRTINDGVVPSSLITNEGSGIFISDKKHNILVDVGQDDTIINNARLLGVDLRDVDICFITHGHYESCNGLSSFLEYNSKAKIYCSTDILGKYYNNRNEFIGADKSIANVVKNNLDRFIFVEDEYYIDNDVYIFSGNDRRSLVNTREIGFAVQSNHRLEPDDFHHELYIIIGDKEKVIVSGCTHKGVCNVMQWTKYENIKAFVGGVRIGSFDKSKPRDVRAADDMIQNLMQYNTTYYVHNCIDKNFYDYLQENMGEKFQQISLGSRFKI